MKVRVAGQIINYKMTEKVQYDHSRGVYYAFVDTNDGERQVVCSSRNGPFIFAADSIISGIYLPARAAVL